MARRRISGVEEKAVLPGPESRYPRGQVTRRKPDIAFEKLQAPTTPLSDEETRSIISLAMDHGIVGALKHHRRTNEEFFKVILVNPELEDLFHKSQKIRAEVGIDESVYIADFERNVDRAKLKILTRQWMAERLLPKKYGNKLSVDVSQTIDLRSSLEEAKRRAGIIDVTSTPVSMSSERRELSQTAGAEFLRDMRSSLAHVPPPLDGEDPVDWAEKQIAKLPIEAQPRPIAAVRFDKEKGASWEESVLDQHAVKKKE